VFWCSSSGDTLGFAHFDSSSHCIVFLATLGMICHLSLGVWTNILFVCLFLFVYICFFCLLINFFVFVTMLLIGHDLHHICGLHVIGMFNLLEHCISLEISICNSCFGLKRFHVFDSFSHAH
jgi:hypothetical protein